MSETDVLTRAKPAQRYRRIAVICNERSGGVGAGDCARLMARLRAPDLGGARVRRIPLRSRGFSVLGRRDLLVVLGGDGTARAAAEACARPNGPTLILLPGGTLNLLPHVLYGARAWPEALDAALAEGEPRVLRGASAGGRAFFIAATFGAPAILATAREAVRRGAFGHALRTTRRFALRAFSRHLSAQVDGAAFGRAEAVAVLAPHYPGVSVDALTREKLEWARFDGRVMSDVLRIGVKAITGGWRDDPTVSTLIGGRGEIRSKGLIPATLDGEPVLFHRRVRIEPLRHAPRVLALPDARP